MNIHLLNIKVRSFEKLQLSNVSERLKYLVIAVFAFLNLIFGLLYQVSRDIICYTELIVLVISSIVYWVLLKQFIHKNILRIVSNDKTLSLKVLSFSGFSISILLLNLVISQVLVILIVSLLLEIQTPSANLLVASLTNNIAGNLFCYTVLVGISIYDYRSSVFGTLLESKKQTHQKDFIMLNTGSSVTKVDFRDITNIESSQNCITLYTKDRKFVKYQSLKSFLEECPYPSFKRIHRSHAVNTEYVSHVKTNDNGDGQVFLKDGTTLKLSRTFKKGLMSA